MKIKKNKNKRMSCFNVFLFSCFNERKGQSLIEVIIAMAIFALVSASLTAMVVGGYSALQQGGQSTEAEALAEQGIEAVRAIRDGAWNKNIYATSAVQVLSDNWEYTGENTTETIGEYIRTITFNDVCRDSATQDIVACPSGYVDAQTKKVTVNISWANTAGSTSTLEKIAYISNWDSGDWIEDLTADFEDGPTFFNTATSTTMGDGDGAVVLSEQ